MSIQHSACDATGMTHFPDIKPRLPTFTGQPDSWEPFLMQLQLMSRSYGWSDSKFRGQLMFALKGEALYFASHLPSFVLDNTKKLVSALTERYGHAITAQTLRASLQEVKQEPAESIQQYGARVNHIMSRAYPGIQGTALHEDLSVEYMLKGLPNKQIAYETLVKKPKDVSQAVNMVIWQEACQSIIFGSNRNKTFCDTGIQTEISATVKNNSPNPPESISVNSSAISDIKSADSSAMVAKVLRQSHGNHQSRQRPRKCFKCRQRGHHADMCPVQQPNISH